MTGAYLPTAGQRPVQQWLGAYYGVVSNTNDPLGQNRVTMKVPQVLGLAVTTWATPLVPISGSPPAVGALVIAIFIGGDPDQPVYLVQGGPGVQPIIDALLGTSAASLEPSGVAAVGTTGLLAQIDHIHPGAGQTGSITAFHPGTTTPETWQPMALATSGTQGTFTTGSGTDWNGDPTYAEYKLLPDGSVRLRVNANCSPMGGTIFNTMLATALPTLGYRPAKRRKFPVAWRQQSIFTGSNAMGSIGILDLTGQIFLFGGASMVSNTNSVSFEVSIDLT